jgi:hypothetical protein
VNRYLYRATYTIAVEDDADSVSYEPVCVRALTEADALAEVDAATDRYPDAVGATKTLTLISTTVEP